ncbi:TAT-variant-translocated molybdopterin oxidoreductase [Salibacteraceae bacterium]|jgi:molybdopterin-containing oxidoreductase family iron-sulfur binding subunit|nr:TAT-variant-translocated molybdopterin oxidoreductase [Salibacteraceae bacterium]
MANEKTYWNSLEQLNGDQAFLETAEKEFKDPIPVEEFVGKQEFDSNTTNRRDFLKFVGFSLGAATLAACETPVIKSIPYVMKPEEVYPGVANWYASSYMDGSEFASILVKTREGRPVFIKGNRDSNITKGGISARGVSSVLSLYDQARYQAPQKKEGGETTWAELDAEVMMKLKEVAASGKTIALATNTIASPSTEAAIKTFQDAFMGERSVNEYDENGEVVGATTITASSVERYTIDPISYSGMREANAKNFGKRVLPNYDFSKAKVIVSVGADFLSTWLNANSYSNQYTSRRDPDGAWMNRHFQFETNMSVTGSNADVRAAIKPSEYGKALANLHNALAKMAGTSGKSFEIDNDNNAAEKIQQAAKELWAAKGASIVVCGSNDPNHQMIANEINNLLGNYGSTIDLNKSLNLSQGNDYNLSQLTNGINQDRVGAVILYGVNPVYNAPAASGMTEALSKVGLKVAIAERPDESTVLCDYVAPDVNFLEAWNDYEVVTGEYSLAQPVIKKLFPAGTRQAQSTLLRWAGAENTDYYTFLTSNWEKNIFTKQSKESFFKAFWNTSLHNGMVSLASSSEVADGTTFTSGASDALASISKEKSDGWELQLYTKTSIGDGRAANNPHLQEMPDPISRISWDNYITMNPADMLDQGYETRTAQETPAHLAKVLAGGQEVTLPVVAAPGQKRNTIGIALGYGRTEAGKAGNGIGQNAYSMSTFKSGNVGYGVTGVSVEKTGETYAIASIQTHHTMMGRKIVNETNVTTYKNVDRSDKQNGWNPIPVLKNAFGEETPMGEVDLWSAQPGIARHHLWGMSIDLNACTGCGACVTSCHINNNVPVVGKDEIRRTRSMFWLRIDRYYTSDADPNKNDGEKNYSEMENPSAYPDAVFQPVMCQHCNHAPCETVCPVAATTHSDEGFNQMAYNRCVGTRYCANNCPYKVRRFNWFNYNADPMFTDVNPSQDDLGRMVLNPDVVVRSRGVMEKCSLCIQDVQAGKLQAKKEGRPVKDGEIQTACSAACANGAIVFGDLNDETEVAKRATHGRSYALLEEVGTRPNVSYLTKVRNRSGEEV